MYINICKHSDIIKQVFLKPLASKNYTVQSACAAGCGQSWTADDTIILY